MSIALYPFSAPLLRRYGPLLLLAFLACVSPDPDLSDWLCREHTDCGTLRPFRCVDGRCRVPCKPNNCTDKERCSEGYCEKRTKPCRDGTKQDCYNGPANARGIGICQFGKQTCTQGKWGPCQGAVLPREEECNDLDDNCNGSIDEGCPCETGNKRPCYTATKGCLLVQGTYRCQGTCRTGTQSCQDEKWSACENERTPLAEICDRQDNDCNGKIDDNTVDSGGICQVPNKKGICQVGQLRCSNGRFLCEQDLRPAKEECNGRDDDCDGQTDEGCSCKTGETQPCYNGPSPTKNIGNCKTGTQFCAGGVWSECQGEKLPQPEDCNGQDDDCDGQTDEKLTQPCFSASRGCSKAGTSYRCQGLCQSGTRTCQNGSWSPCQGEVVPQPEDCNGQDDDCDGRIDENATRQCFSGKTGCRLSGSSYRCTSPCRAGTQLCQSGTWSKCQGERLPQEEVCDRQDNDCNGQIDDVTRSCFRGSTGCTRQSDGEYTCQGSCQAGKQSCSFGRWGACQGEVVPQKEDCNGKDDDCNGQIDDNLVQSCYTGPSGTANRGLCQQGTRRCESGKWSPQCQGEVTPQKEQCNRKDDDCDGSVDESVTRPCYSGKEGCTPKADGSFDCEGACRPGTQTCRTGSWLSCQNEILPQSEQCNNKDDDCDGQINENILQCVATLAGDGRANYLNGQGTKAQFNSPRALVVSPAGDIYITDTNNQRIRKIDPSGDVTTFAGSGTRGKQNGPPTTAQFNFPYGLVLDRAGNLYVADSSNHLLRKIDSSGNVTGYAGDGLPGLKNGSLSTARFQSPGGLAWDNKGNLYIADTGNHSIRKIDASGTVTTFAGNGTAGYKDGPLATALFKNPNDLAWDNKGNLYIVDTGNHSIRKIDASGTVTTFAGNGTAGSQNGTAGSARFRAPLGLTLDSTGNLYIADSSNHLIRKIDPSGQVTTFAGGGTSGLKSGPLSASLFATPAGLALDHKGNLYIVDSKNHSIRKIVLK